MDDRFEKFKEWLKLMDIEIEMTPYQENLAKIMIDTPPTYVITRRKH